MTEETQNQAEPSLSESLVRRAIAITNRALWFPGYGEASSLSLLRIFNPLEYHVICE